MSKIQDQYYRMPENEMQELIEKAKLGHGPAQVRLLYEFRNFLSKYVNLLYYTKYDASNYDMRRFIALYIPDPIVRRSLLRGKLNYGGLAQVNKSLQDIQFMVERYGTEEDVRSTIEMTFLECVNRYKRSRSKSKPDEWVPFSGFLYSYFFYMLKKNVDEYLIDQLGLKTFPLMSDESPGEEDDENSSGYLAPPEPSAEELFGPEEIDEYWVLGDTALPPFDGLNIQERQLIKWRFVDGYRSSDIANRITEHPNTVREHFNRIRAKIREAIEEDGVI